LYGFCGSVSIQKTGLALAFFLSSSNKNRGKAFAVPSEKKQQWQHGADLKLGWQRLLPLLGHEDDMIVDMDEMHAKLTRRK
jgi:hypothetical protein